MKRAGRVCSVGLRRCAPEAWSRFVCGPLRGPCRRGRPCGFGPQGLLCGPCALHAGAPVVRAPASSIRRPGPRVARGPWSRRRARAAGSCVALSSCAPGFSASWRRVGLGVSFLKRSLRATPAPAAVSFVGGRCHGPCFSPLAKPRSALPRPAPFVRAGRDKARSNPVGGGESGRNQLSEKWRDRGGVSRLGPGAGSVSARRRSRVAQGCAA